MIGDLNLQSRIARQSGHTRFPLCEGDLDHVIGQVRGRFGGEVGERVHQCQSDGGFQRAGEQGGRAPRLVVSRRGCRGQVLAEVGDVRRQIHDTTMTSHLVSVKGKHDVIMMSFAGSSVPPVTLPVFSGVGRARECERGRDGVTEGAVDREDGVLPSGRCALVHRRRRRASLIL